MSRGQPEFALSCVVADWLALALPTRAVWSHLPFGENRDERAGARLKRIGTHKGWPDYLIILDGMVIAIELKLPGTYQKPEQKAFADALVANGGHYQVCRSLDAVEVFLTACRVLLRVPARKIAA